MEYFELDITLNCKKCYYFKIMPMIGIIKKLSQLIILFLKKSVENFDIDKKIDEFCMMKNIECNSRYKRVI